MMDLYTATTPHDRKISLVPQEPRGRAFSFDNAMLTQ